MMFVENKMEAKKIKVLEKILALLFLAKYYKYITFDKTIDNGKCKIYNLKEKIKNKGG